MTECLSAYDRDGLRKQAEKREADKQRRLDASDDLLAACKALIPHVAEYRESLHCEPLTEDIIVLVHQLEEVEAWAVEAIAKANAA